METTYYDTADLRLARWGCSLRFRTREGWTVKLPLATAGEALERTEQRFSGTAKTPPRAAVQLVSAYLRGTSLVPVARLSTLRHRVRLTGRGGGQLAEVVDDEVTVLEGRRVAARFREVEVEMAEDGEAGGALLGAVRKRLLAAGAEPGNQTPKLVRALGPRATAPPEVVPSPLPKRPTAGELVAHSMSKAVAELLANDPGVRVGTDPEAVHKARVAVRTLRSHLRTFGRLLGSEPPFGERLRELGAELGEVRDREVMLDLLRDQANKLPERDRNGAAAIHVRLEAEIECAKQRLAAFMNTLNYVELLGNLVELAAAPKFNKLAELNAAQAAVELAQRPWRQLRKAVQALPDSPEVDQLHRIRILAKRTRYAADAVIPMAGRRAARFAAAAEALQTVLGDYHDAIVAEEWLRSTAGSGRKAYAAGALGALILARAEWMRARWPAAWDSLDRKCLREWFNT